VNGGYNTDALTVRWWYGRGFIDSSTVSVQGGNGASGFYITSICTVDGNGIITVPSTSIYSTLDAIDPAPQSIQFFGRLYSGNTPRQWITAFNSTPTGWVVQNPTPLSALTFEELVLENQSIVLANPPQTFWTIAQTQAYIASQGTSPLASDVVFGRTKLDIAPTSAINPVAVGANSYAATNHLGITKLATAPLSATNPIAVGSNDPRLGGYINVMAYGAIGDDSTDNSTAFTNAQTAAAAVGAALYIPVGTFRMIGGFAFTSPVIFAPGGIVKHAGGSLSFSKAVIADPSPHFASTSTISVSFPGNTSIDRYYIDWWGTPAGSDDTAICEAAVAAFPIGAYVKLIPNRVYATQGLTVKQGQTWDLTGATIIALPGTSFPNETFDIGATNPLDLNGTFWTTNTAMSSAIAGATSITVTSSAGFTAGDRIVVSAGSFTGSGVEFGPIEFNTVASIPDGTHINVKTPLAYNYSGFGLAGAANLKVYKVPANQPRNIKIFGGTIQPSASFTGPYLNINGAENVEVCNILFNGLAGGLTTGGYVSGLNFHDCQLKGNGLISAAVNFNFASLVYSRITDNLLSLGGNTLLNGSNLEVTCHDNIVSDNIIGPVRATAVAGIEFNKSSFNNQVTDNNIWGLSADVTANVITRGIRTQSSPAGTGNLIQGNTVRNVFIGIADNADNSLVDGNVLASVSSPSTSTGILTDSLKGTIGDNTITGFDRNTVDSALTGVPTLRRTLGRSYRFEGNGSPEGVITAPVSSMHSRLDGGASTSLYVKGSGTGNTGWVALGSGSSSALTQVDVSSYATGGDGSPGSPWTGWNAATPWAANTAFYFKDGYYSTSTTVLWGLSGIGIIFSPGAIINYTGAGVGIRFDATDYVSNVGAYLVYINVKGLRLRTTTGTDGVVVNRVFNCSFDLNVGGFSSHQTYFYRSITNLVWLKSTTGSEANSIANNGFPNVTTYGDYALYIADDGGGSCNENEFFVNIENAKIAGIYMGKSYRNSFSGTSEGNGVGPSLGCGMIVSANASWNYIALDNEGNPGGEQIYGPNNVFMSNIFTDLVRLYSGAYRNTFFGGLFDSVQVDSGANGNEFHRGTYNWSGSGTIVDNAINTYWDLRDKATGNLKAKYAFGGEGDHLGLSVFNNSPITYAAYLEAVTANGAVVSRLQSAANGNGYTGTFSVHPFGLLTSGTPRMTVSASQPIFTLAPVAFASLGAPTAGSFAYCSDSNTATWGATIAGGGSNKVLAFFGGTNWTVFAV
jgi:hypothetical protein